MFNRLTHPSPMKYIPISEVHLMIYWSHEIPINPHEIWSNPIIFGGEIWLRSKRQPNYSHSLQGRNTLGRDSRGGCLGYRRSIGEVSWFVHGYIYIYAYVYIYIYVCVCGYMYIWMYVERFIGWYNWNMVVSQNPGTRMVPKIAG